jgi:hypothetical protein
MNIKDKAINKIIEFLNSDSKFLLLTGTHQNKKHLLALSVIFNYSPSPQKVLFRANSMQNISTFLPGKRSYKTGEFVREDKHYLAVDTINPTSWRATPKVDIAVIYPIDSLTTTTADENIEDLINRRSAKKIILVSWTDNKDIYWAKRLEPVEVVYDAEEEDLEYHKRVEGHTVTVRREQIPNLPEYAKGTPPEYLTKLHCYRCGSSRWARLNKRYPGKSVLHQASYGEYKATCLKCGYEATDNYKWYGQ